MPAHTLPQRFIRFFSVPLERLLIHSWQALVIGLAVLLIADALVFYRYGGGENIVPERGAPAEALNVREDLIKSAASLIAARRTKFQSAPAIGADLPNPFH
jgi:hypothetical protein